MRNPLRLLVERVQRRNPLLLSHHPTCEYYSHHTFELYGAQLCMGCFVVYPVGFLSLVTLSLARLLGVGIAAVPTVTLYVVGFGLAVPKVVETALPTARGRRVRLVCKVSLAVGLAVLAFPLLFRPGDRLVTAGLFVGFLAPYVGQKFLTVREDCEGCPEYDDFPECSGMEFHQE